MRALQVNKSAWWWNWEGVACIKQNTDDILSHLHLCHFADDIFWCIFVNEKFVLWLNRYFDRIGDKPLSDSMPTDSLTHTCSTRDSLWHRNIVAMSYGLDVKSYVCIATYLMSYGRVSKSCVWDRYTVAMSYGWDVKSYLWDSKRPHVIRTRK